MDPLNDFAKGKLLCSVNEKRNETKTKSSLAKIKIVKSLYALTWVDDAG